jgi:Golgi phosphoprotein 3 (GPP34)
MHDPNVSRSHGQSAAGPGHRRGPVNSRLAGTGRIADDLYLMAHHERTGKPLLQPRPLGLGLAGGLLAELVLGDSIGLWSDGAVLAGRTWPGDDLARRVRNQIAAEPGPRPLPEWLAYLARTAAPDVAARLECAGYLTRVRDWVPGRPGRLIPADPDWAFGPLLRVRSALDPTRPFEPREAVLAGLAVACGLRYRLDQYAAPVGRSLEEATGYLGLDLRELIAQTQAAVDSALLSHRT